MKLVKLEKKNIFIFTTNAPNFSFLLFVLFFIWFKYASPAQIDHFGISNGKTNSS